MTFMYRTRLLIGCLLGLVTFPACFAEYIYFASAGGAEGGGERPGLYGGPISNIDSGEASNLYVSGYQCAVLDPALDYSFNELKFRSVSYDPVSKNLLMHMMNSLTLLKSPVCRAQPPNCINQTTYITPIFVERGFSREIRPVTYYDSKVYFLSYTSETLNTREKMATLELRMFKGCETLYPVTPTTAFDLESCSERLATVREERYDLAPTFKTSEHLLAIRESGYLRFFTMLQHFNYGSRKALLGYTMQLVTISRGKVDVLHEEEVSISFNAFVLEQIGGISYSEGVLCWSAISRILCADWRNGKLDNIRYVLENNEATSVCKGTSDKISANVTTGVAIATTRPLVVYFGCMCQRPGKGGMGMITVGSDGAINIRTVLSNGHPVLAGSMFLTQECKEEKPKPSNGQVKPTNNISGGSTPGGSQPGQEPEQAEVSSASGANCILGLLTYAHLTLAAILFLNSNLF